MLIQSLNPGHINGGSGTQYFVGDFDGKNFVLDASFAKDLDQVETKWLDFGRDNYAGVTWSNIPKSDGRTLFIGWMSNWDYARDVPTEKWRSTMTIPRELKLNKNNTIYTVYSQPVKELNNALTQEKFKDSITLEEFNKLSNNKTFNYDRLRLSLDLKDLKEEEYKLIFYNAIGDTLSLGLNNISKEYFVDRTKSGKTEFSTKFAPKVSIRKLPTSLNQLSIDLLLDKTSVEVFFNKGETVMTELFFPNALLEQMAILSEDRSFSLESLKIEELKID